MYLQDDYYTYGIANPKWSWMSSINPLNDAWYGMLYSLPNGLHNFKYHRGTNPEAWYFDFLHHDLTLTDSEGTGASVNTPVSDEAVNELKSVVAQGIILL